MSKQILPWLNSELPATMKLLDDGERKRGLMNVMNAVDWKLLGQYEIPVPAARFITRLLPGGVLASEETYWKLSSFLRRAEMQSFILSGGVRQELPLISCQYSMELLRWIAQDYCISPSLLVEKSIRFVQIANEQLRYTLMGIDPADINEFEDIFGGGDRLRQSTIDMIEDMEIGFGDEDRRWAQEQLFPFVYS